MQKYINKIENLWHMRTSIRPDTTEYSAAQSLVYEVIDMLNNGIIRVCDKLEGDWVVNEWVKKAVLLFFALNPNKPITSSISSCYDKVPMKFFPDMTEEEFKKIGCRVVPGAIARYGSYIGKNVVLMPSFVNIGAYIDDGTMVDTWATIGSCAQIGKKCHISGGAGIGGVLEPLQAKPVIIEDGCFIGARSEIVEGVIVEEGAVIAMGVYLGASTKIYDTYTKEISYGRIPAFSVVVPGSLPDTRGSGASLYCAVIIKKVDESTREKTSINELLRA